MSQSHRGYSLAGTSDPATSAIIPSRKGRVRVLLNILKGLGTVLVVVALVAIVKIYTNSHTSLLEAPLSRPVDLQSKLPFTKGLLLGNTNIHDHGKTQFQDSLSQSEKERLQKLKEEIADKMTHSYMKTNSYFIRWLRARNWDVENTKQMLLDHLEWRVEYEIDSVLEANFTFFEWEYPLYSDGFDYNGGPVVSINMKDWDLRKLTIGGHEREFLRYLFREFERGVKYGLDSQAKGMDISQGICLLNMAGYSLSKHGCFACMKFMGRYLLQMDNNYPAVIRHIIMINASELAKAFLDLVLPYLNEDNSEGFKVYGSNKEEWQREILSLVPADQIRPEFGGTKVGLELEE